MKTTTVIPPADPARLLFETAIVEQIDDEACRGGRRVGARLSFGEPAVYDLVTLIESAGSEPGFDVHAQLEHYDFRLVRLVTTLHVEPRSAVSWFEVHVALTPVLMRVGYEGVVSDPPIAHDLYPLLVAGKVSVSRTATISPSFKFAGETEISVGEVGVTTQYERLEPTITAYGKRETTPYWRFTPGGGGEVVGGVKEMDLIVRKPRGIPVRATILAKGRGRQWGIIPDPVAVSEQQFDI